MSSSVNLSLSFIISTSVSKLFHVNFSLWASSCQLQSLIFLMSTSVSDLPHVNFSLWPSSCQLQSISVSDLPHDNFSQLQSLSFLMSTSVSELFHVDLSLCLPHVDFSLWPSSALVRAVLFCQPHQQLFTHSSVRSVSLPSSVFFFFSYWPFLAQDPDSFRGRKG